MIAPKPKAPPSPHWAALFLVAAILVYLDGESWFHIDRTGRLVLAAILVLAWIAPHIQHWRLLRRHEVDEIRWRIASLEEAVRSYETELRAGQPSYDDDSPENWEFDRKYLARRAQEQLEELEGVLEQKLRGL